MKHCAVVFLACAFLFPLSVFADQPGDEVLGVWHTADDKAQVQIFRTGKVYSGKIISLKEPNWPASDKLGMGGKPKNDRNNPNEALRQRPIVGMQVMSGFVLDGKEVWTGGKVYDPESGNSYKGNLRLKNLNRLEMRGYVGFSLLGRTEVWTR